MNRVLHVERRLKMLKYYKRRRFAYATIGVILLIPSIFSYLRIPTTSGIVDQLNDMSAREERLGEESV